MQKQQNPAFEDSSGSDSEDDDENSDDSSDNNDDPTQELIRESKREAAEQAKANRKAKKRAAVEEGEAVAGEEFAALCINFIVNSREDIDFGALPGVLAAADMVPV